MDLPVIGRYSVDTQRGAKRSNDKCDNLPKVSRDKMNLLSFLEQKNVPQSMFKLGITEVP